MQVVSNFIACVASGEASGGSKAQLKSISSPLTAGLRSSSFKTNLLALTNSPAATQGNKVRDASALQKDLNNLSMLIKAYSNCHSMQTIVQSLEFIDQSIV